MKEGNEEKQLLNEEPQSQPPQLPPESEVIDPIAQLVQNSNPIHLLAVIDHININQRQVDGVPLLSLLCNKFLPLDTIFQGKQIQFKSDPDGRTPLHYAIEVDDIKTVSWCLRRGAKNVADKFGNTPIMDALRLGHKRSFLLCLHYQHYDEELPKLAAQFNRVWELQILNKLELLGSELNIEEALKAAVESYNYEACEYLASIAPAFNLYKIRLLTDSRGIISSVMKGRQLKESIQSPLKQFFWYFAPTFVLFLGIYFLTIFSVNRSERLLFLLVLCLLWIGIFCINQFTSSIHNGPESIPQLLEEPDFPILGQICSSCCDFQQQGYDHCRRCRKCVKKFHFHGFACIHQNNELLWYLFEYGTLFLVWSLLSQIYTYHEFRTIKTAQEMNSLLLFFRMVETTFNTSILEFIFFMFLFFYFLHQMFLCLQMFGMAFMNKTYQQVTRSHEYPYLYEPVKTKDNVIINKEITVFGRYRLCGGIIMGIKNIVMYFF